ncbi:MAG: hypothetical protein M0R46_17995, partial [Candidatus Muirbacterium halophilum]|nr:hypothetical protein [Candidatus Muirbacterium halophilum]
IKKISSINPSNIDGIGLGESPEIYEPFKVTVNFITDYQNNQKDVIILQYIDEKYGTVNDIILFETENDSRIFYYEEDTNELDIRPDSIEIKINYPLPYPQILERAGESKRNIISEKSEIEYIKKAGILLNDVDENGKIEAEEIIKATIYKAPDYTSDEEKEKYYISNTLISQKNCKSSSQKEFVTDFTKFNISLYDKTERNTKKTFTIVFDGVTYEKEVAINTLKANFKTGPYIVINSGDLALSELIQIDEKYYYDYNGERCRVLFTSKTTLDNKDIMIISDNVIRIKPFVSPAYSLYSYYTVVKDLSGKKKRAADSDVQQMLAKFRETNNAISEIGYNVYSDVTPTIDEFKKQLKSNSFDILYYAGHGNIVSDEPGIYLFKTLESIEEDGVIFPGDISGMGFNGKIRFLFLNCCLTGRKLERFQKVFNADCAVGWTDTIGLNEYEDFAAKLIMSMKDGKTIGEVKESILRQVFEGKYDKVKLTFKVINNDFSFENKENERKNK